MPGSRVKVLSSNKKKVSVGLTFCPVPGCEFSTSWDYNLVRHQHLVHNPNRTKDYHCPICGKDFDLKHNFRRHLHRVHPESNSNLDDLENVKKKVSSPFVSAQSQQSFRQSTSQPSSQKLPPSQKNHSKFNGHSGLKGPKGQTDAIATEFKYYKCGSSYSSRSNLHRHVKCCQHENGKQNRFAVRMPRLVPAVTLPSPRVKSSGNNKLKRSKYRCGICNAAFKRRQDLLNHQRVHEDAKPFSCSVCSFRSKWASNVRDHERRLHGRGNRITRRVKGAKRNNKPPKLSVAASRHKGDVEDDQQEDQVQVEEMEQEEVRSCLFCEYVAKLSRFLQKHFLKCPGCHRSNLNICPV